MNRRLNDTALTLIERVSIFENHRSFLNLSDKLVEKLCNCFSLNEYEKVGVLLDYISFVLVALQKVEDQECLIDYVPEASIGYEHLKNFAESILYVSIATAITERSFKAINRIMTKLCDRIEQDTLQYYMKISIASDKEPSIE